MRSGSLLWIGLLVAILGDGREAFPRLAISPRPDHVVIVVEENRPFSGVIGSASAPYINELAAQGALFTQSFAVTHPSQPNYLALFSGSTQGVTDDHSPPAGSPYDAPNLGSELIRAGWTFAGYSEDLPYAGYAGNSWDHYRRRHNPWVDFSNVPPESNLPFASFPGPDAYDALPTVSFVVPNLINDMHYSTTEHGDEWLRAHLDVYVQWAKYHNSLLILTWDEDDFTEENRIVTIFVGAGVKPGSYDERIDHYRVLRTIEDFYGLPHVGHTNQVRPIRDVWEGLSAPGGGAQGNRGCGTLGIEALLVVLLARVVTRRPTKRTVRFVGLISRPGGA